nr:Uncharacterised protein [Escherichia coli]
MLMLTTTAIDVDEELLNRCTGADGERVAGADGSHPRGAASRADAGRTAGGE